MSRLDSFPVPVIENYEGIYVVRDDLLGYGSKIRFLDKLIGELPEDEIVFGSSPRWGFGQISIAHVCKRHGKKFTLFIAKSDEYHPYTQRAIEQGANVISVPMGFLAVTECRAREYANEDMLNRYLFPIGIEHPLVLEAIKETAQKIDLNPHHVWTASSSGTLHRGLSLAWPDAEIHVVPVGHTMDERQKGRAILHPTKYKFGQVPKKNELPPFPCALHYEAKVWKVMKDYYGEGKEDCCHDYWNNFGELKVLLWNVGS